MRTAMQPVETGAFLRNGHYVSSDDSGVYAVRTFRSTVRRVGTEGRWTRIGVGGDESLTMGIAASDRLDADLVELTVFPSGWEVSMRRGQMEPRVVVRGKFEAVLEANRTYRFEMDAADGTVTVRLPGVEKNAKLGTIGLLGKHAFWQHNSPSAELPIGVKFCIDMVWVAEQDQPLSPLPPAY